jgi:hypothetical protein
MWRGGHAVGPPLPIHRPWHVLLRTSRTARSTSMHVPRSCSDCQWYSFQWRLQIMQADVAKHAGLPNSHQKDILKTHYKYTLVAVTHKFNVSGHMLMWTFFLLWCVEVVRKICPHLSVTACINCSNISGLKFTRIKQHLPSNDVKLLFSAGTQIQSHICYCTRVLL